MITSTPIVMRLKRVGVLTRISGLRPTGCALPRCGATSPANDTDANSHLLLTEDLGTGEEMPQQWRYIIAYLLYFHLPCGLPDTVTVSRTIHIKINAAQRKLGSSRYLFSLFEVISHRH